MKKNILIYGITGQDGSLLAKLLLKKNFTIYGFTRKKKLDHNNNLVKIGIQNKVKIFYSGRLSKKLIESHILQSQPTIIYNFAGESSVSESFKKPFRSSSSMINLTLYILESIKKINKKIKYFNAMSGDCYGNAKIKINENTKFNPISPYGITKLQTHFLTKFYRYYYNLYAVNGIFFNHESSLRSDKFVIKKIIKNVTLIYLNKLKHLEIGDVNVSRDWGCAEDYMKISYKIMTFKRADDFIIATGRSVKVIDIIKICFEYFNLNYKHYLKINENFFRKSDIRNVKVSNKKILSHLKWSPQPIEKLIIKLCAIEKKKLIKKLNS